MHGVEWGVCGVECEVWAVERIVARNVTCGVRSLKSGVPSVTCRG